MVRLLMWELSLWPEAASTFADRVDQVYLVLSLLAVLVAVPVAGLIVYFAFKYRRGSPADRSGAVPTSHTLETLWIAVPVVVLLGIFSWSAGLYVDMYTMPPDGLDIYGVGKQWMWQFEHPSGQREINELHIPLNSKVRLTLVAQDVIHSFYVPAFRVKRDVLPGRYTTAWFEATKTGRFHLFCAEYCGTQHSGMIGAVVVMEPRQYQDWLSQRPLDLANPILETANLEGQAPATMGSQGEALFVRLGCPTCHHMDGTGTGPSLVGLFGSEVELANGTTVSADADYIRRSIIEPNAEVVAGHPPMMPTFAGQVDEAQLLHLVEYVRSLGGEVSE